MCRLKGVGALLTVQALSGAAAALPNSSLPLVLQRVLNLSVRDTGLVFSYTGAVSMAGAPLSCSVCLAAELNTVCCSYALHDSDITYVGT